MLWIALFSILGIAIGLVIFLLRPSSEERAKAELEKKRQQFKKSGYRFGILFMQTSLSRKGISFAKTKQMSGKRLFDLFVVECDYESLKTYLINHEKVGYCPPKPEHFFQEMELDWKSTSLVRERLKSA